MAGVEALSAETNNDAEQPLTGDVIEWADTIVAMECRHRDRISAKFGYRLRGKPLVVLGIPAIMRIRSWN